MTTGRLSEEAIQRELGRLPAWTREGGELVAAFDRGSFDAAIAFVNGIAAFAKAANHHPDLAISSGDVLVRLTTRDAGALTDRDFSLARAIDALANT